LAIPCDLKHPDIAEQLTPVVLDRGRPSGEDRQIGTKAKRNNRT
jgi:hypothetical protein